MNTTFIGSLLLGIVAPAFAQGPAPDPTNDNQGYISVRDVNERHCSIPVGAAGSGLDAQYEFAADLSPCGDMNNTARKIALYNLPSATQLIFTDSDTCETSKEPGKSTFWFKLKTIKKITQPGEFTMAFPFLHANGEIITEGVLLVDKHLEGDSVDALDKLSCIRVINSRATLPKPVAPVTTAPRAWEDAGNEHNSKFHCQGNYILIGRAHDGDEEEPTQYRCASASQGSGAVSLKNHRQAPGQHEATSYFVCPKDMVMTGREHDGDERGETRYTCAEAYLSDDTRLLVRPDPWSDEMKESAHLFECPSNKVLIGRTHEGDENDPTRYRCGTLYLQPPP